ncbi:MAG: HAD family hydrolase [Pseudomonadota bacterium]
MVRAILLDKDGTLTDFRATWERWLPGALRDLARESGADPGRLGDAIGFDLARGRIRSGALFVTATGRQTAAAMAAEAGWPADRLSSWLAVRFRAVPQVAVTPAGPFLATLQGRGLTLGVLTNADEAEAIHHLGQLGALPYLARVIGCDSGYGPKPDPAGALAFADDLGLDPAEIAIVGDGMTDMGAARAAGMVAVAVLTGALDRSDLAPHADVVLEDVTGLPAWLDARATA